MLLVRQLLRVGLYVQGRLVHHGEPPLPWRMCEYLGVPHRVDYCQDGVVLPATLADFQALQRQGRRARLLHRLEQCRRQMVCLEEELLDLAEGS